MARSQGLARLTSAREGVFKFLPNGAPTVFAPGMGTIRQSALVRSLCASYRVHAIRADTRDTPALLRRVRAGQGIRSRDWNICPNNQSWRIRLI